jgi:hypothetical protein
MLMATEYSENKFRNTEAKARLARSDAETIYFLNDFRIGARIPAKS